ncbi:MAG: DUF4339 domain-containing protein, partial [Boseongicola sp.]|nr:DUF4339 domain-containing protein [Boseongicola sp.]
PPADALGHPSSGAGQAMGMGLGAAMGMQMAGQTMGPWGARPVIEAASPPPPPVEHVWHIAKDGKTEGPFSKAEIGQRADKGSVDRETWVWTAGQDGWKRAEDTELAELFTVSPPPPPGS